MKFFLKVFLKMFLYCLLVLVAWVPNLLAQCIDSDQDGYGNPGDISCLNGNQTDCDDLDASVYPGAAEICDGKDSNCDGYQSTTDVDIDADGVAWCAGDCDDNDPTRYPGATEICNSIDDDCNGILPYNEKDPDGDGVKLCDSPPDCNDFDASIYPGSVEICGDNKDNNCDGSTDEAGCICPDADGDGHELALCGGDDCDDTDSDVYTGATEICVDGKDNNCDGLSDCTDSTCQTNPDCLTCVKTDRDGDNYSTTGGICGSIDCDDNDPNVYPGAVEICDGKDSNCDGTRSSTDVDADGDGVAWCAGDCDDNDPARYPEAREVCDDGIDNDCDSRVDDSDIADCGPPTCGTKTTPKDPPHLADLLNPDESLHPDSTELLCGKCHYKDAEGNAVPGGNYQCQRCHADPSDTSDPLNGVLKAKYPAPFPYGFGSAPNVKVHSSLTLGTKYGDWDMHCVTCHNPHQQEQNRKYGTSYGKLIKEYICLDNQATGKHNESYVEFTAGEGPGSFADGPPYNENICETCHTRTNHHQNDGTAPGHQSHNDEIKCTKCHLHSAGFSPAGATPQPPHNTEEFLSNCNYCHMDDGNGIINYSAEIPSAKCEQCHTPLGILKDSFPEAPNVLAHTSENGSGKYVYNNSCVDCHNPMFEQTNMKLIRSTLSGSVVPESNIVFTGHQGENSFADGPPHNENICETCHTITNHHHYDGGAPADNDELGYIGHNDGKKCTSCHSHSNAFLPTQPPPPHNVFDCVVCHTADANGNIVDAVINSPIDNSKCYGCHKSDSPNAQNGGSDIKVVAHYSDKYIDPLTGQLASLNCVECHNPMRPQINFRNNLNRAFIRSLVRGTPVVFEAKTGPYSFAYDLSDRPADMSTENYVCNTCHTQTNHHQADGTSPGGQVHNSGRDCTMCHKHERGFQPPRMRSGGRRTGRRR